MSNETAPFIINMPVLDDEAFDTVNAFLWDLVTQFESQYFAQLQRHRQKLNASWRDPLEPWKNASLASHPSNDDELDEDLNDDIPF